MTRPLALTTLGIASIVGLMACGDGGPGAPVSFRPPNGTGTTPFAGGPGDRAGTGTDRGNGATGAIGGGRDNEDTETAATGPAACSKSAPCSHGLCSTKSATATGYCIDRCETEGCPSGYTCTSAGDGKLCLIPCALTSDCPAVAGLTASCARLTETLRACIWSFAQTPS